MAYKTTPTETEFNFPPNDPSSADIDISAKNGVIPLNTNHGRNPVGEISFQRDRLIGRGKYSTVFCGVLYEQQIAVKKIELCDSQALYADREEEALRELDHPNVVKLLCVEESPNSADYYRLFALELAVASLDHWRRGHSVGILPAKEEAFMQLSKGLQYIHSNGFVHCDLKPSKILIFISSSSKPVKLKISGFRLCERLAEDGTIPKPYRVLEDKGWTSPDLWLSREMYESDGEMLSPKRCSVAVDIWSLGCLFYFMMTKHHPFGKEFIDEFNTIFNNLIFGNPMGLKEKLKKTSLPPFTYRDIYELINDMINIDPLKRISVYSVIKRLETLQELSKIKEIKANLFDQAVPAESIKKTCCCHSKCIAIVEQLELTIAELKQNIGANEASEVNHSNESDKVNIVSSNPAKEYEEYIEISSLYQAVKCYGQVRDLGKWTKRDIDQTCHVVAEYLKQKKSEEKFAEWYYYKAISYKGKPNDDRKEILGNHPIFDDGRMNYCAVENYKAANLVNYLADPITNWSDHYRESQSPVFLIALFESFQSYSEYLSFPPSGVLTLGTPLKMSVASGSMSIELGERVTSDDKITIAQTRINLGRNLHFFLWLDEVITNCCNFSNYPLSKCEHYDLIGNIFVDVSSRKRKTEFNSESGKTDIDLDHFCDKASIVYNLKYTM